MGSHGVLALLCLFLTLKDSWNNIQYFSNMSAMTDAEADELDELLTSTTPKIRKGEGGFFTKERNLLNALDPVAANYIRCQAEIKNLSPSQIIGELVRKELQPVEG